VVIPLASGERQDIVPPTVVPYLPCPSGFGDVILLEIIRLSKPLSVPLSSGALEKLPPENIGAIYRDPPMLGPSSRNTC
jgi:hypothetical protein